MSFRYPGGGPPTGSYYPHPYVGYPGFQPHHDGYPVPHDGQRYLYGENGVPYHPHPMTTVVATGQQPNGPSSTAANSHEESVKDQVIDAAFDRL